MSLEQSTFPLAARFSKCLPAVFSCSLADFATPQVLGGHSFPVLPTQAYLQITGMYDFKGGAALSFLLIIPALIVYGLQNFWVSRRSFVTVTGKGRRKKLHQRPGPLITAVVLGTVTFISAFVLYLYSIILIGSLIKVWGVDNSLTFENYHYVFTFGSKAIKDTLIIACVGTPIGGLLAVLIGYVTKWLKVKAIRR